MGAGQSIIESEAIQREEGVMNVAEINKLLGNTVFKCFDFSPKFYEAYTDPDKLQKMRQDYEASFTKVNAKNT